MKPTTTLALTSALTALAFLTTLALSPAEDVEKIPQPAIRPTLPNDEFSQRLNEPPAPLVPKGTKVTEEIQEAIQLIQADFIDPVHSYANRRALMSRALVRMDVELHFAITDTSDSLLPFDLYQSHRSGEWTKIASGVCHPGMKSIKVALPETGVMVDPIKHPLFAAALTEHKRTTEKRAG